MQPHDKGIRRFPLNRGRTRPHRAGTSVEVIGCSVDGKRSSSGKALCAYQNLVGRTAFVVRTELGHALVQFNSGYMKWLPQAHIKEV